MFTAHNKQFVGFLHPDLVHVRSHFIHAHCAIN
jgi:hypothetical protein